MHNDDVVIILTTEAHRRLVDEVLPALALEYPGTMAASLDEFFGRSLQHEYGDSILFRETLKWDTNEPLPHAINEALMRLREHDEDLHLLVTRDGRKIRQIGQPMPDVFPEIHLRNVVEIDDSKFIASQPWDEIINPKNGWTRAHEAALYGTLPLFFSDWAIEDYSGWTVAHEAALHGKLPEGFNQWGLRDLNGDTVAHVTLIHDFLPENFSKWSLRNKTGDTVAHLAARLGKLPVNFDQWPLINTHEATFGNTVAHAAAECDLLPEEFNQWDLQNCNGYSVAHTMLMCRHRLPDTFSRWDIADKFGWTVAHEAAVQNCLPDDFSEWDLADSGGWTVAHEAAKRGVLPKNFDMWELQADGGLTVREVAEKVAAYKQPRQTQGM
jgi:hypothetical protein